MLPHPCHATFQLIYKSLLQNKIHPPSREYLKKKYVYVTKKKFITKASNFIFCCIRDHFFTDI